MKKEEFLFGFAGVLAASLVAGMVWLMVDRMTDTNREWDLVQNCIGTEPKLEKQERLFQSCLSSVTGLTNKSTHYNDQQEVISECSNHAYSMARRQCQSEVITVEEKK